ncbi:MAG: YbjN domain-containing protein [Robiginitomaculum sp.]|nr:YbjN domain-containing protein [Robiginitomaculum sp.]
MRVFLFIFILLVATTNIVVAQGTRVVHTAFTIQDLAETLDLLGLKYTQEPVDGLGVIADNRLVVDDGVVWFIYGYNCQDAEQSCTEFQMRAVIQETKQAANTLLDIDQWNRENRFVRAYRSPSGNALILEMDVYLAGGVALGNVTDQILLWRQSLRKFSLAIEAHNQVVTVEEIH